jgi:outer membrane protein TolC
MRMGMKRKNSIDAMKMGAACAASMAVVLLGGCRVGPKYVKPTMAATAPEFKESATAAYANASDGTWRPAQPQDAMLKGKWWEVFNEPELNTLEDQLDINNQNIAVYFQNFMAARAQVREARSQFYPTLTTDPSYTRQKTPGTLRNAVATTSTGSGTGTASNGGRRLPIYLCRSMWRGSRICGGRFGTR